MAKSSSKKPARVEPSAARKNVLTKPVKRAGAVKSKLALKEPAAKSKTAKALPAKPLTKKTVKSVSSKLLAQSKATKKADKPAVKVSPATGKKSVGRPAAKAAILKASPAKTARTSVVSTPSPKPARNHKPQISKPAGPVMKPTAKLPPSSRPVSPPIQLKPSAKPAQTKSPALKPVANKPEPFQAQPAVATNLKPKKSQVGLTVKELEHFADLLFAKRRELVGDMSSMEREALRTGSSSNLSTLPVHMADMGTDNFEQEFTLTLVEKDRNLLREINHALAKIQNGTYGICEGTGMPISKVRLEAAPWAKFSIEYARQKEKNGLGIRTI